MSTDLNKKVFFKAYKKVLFASNRLNEHIKNIPNFLFYLEPSRKFYCAYPYEISLRTHKVNFSGNIISFANLVAEYGPNLFLSFIDFSMKYDSTMAKILIYFQNKDKFYIWPLWRKKERLVGYVKSDGKNVTITVPHIKLAYSYPII